MFIPTQSNRGNRAWIESARMVMRSVATLLRLGMPAALVVAMSLLGQWDARASGDASSQPTLAPMRICDVRLGNDDAGESVTLQLTLEAGEDGCVLYPIVTWSNRKYARVAVPYWRITGENTVVGDCIVLDEKGFEAYFDTSSSDTYAALPLKKGETVGIVVPVTYYFRGVRARYASPSLPTVVPLWKTREITLRLGWVERKSFERTRYDFPGGGHRGPETEGTYLFYRAPMEFVPIQQVVSTRIAIDASLPFWKPVVRNVYFTEHTYSRFSR